MKTSLRLSLYSRALAVSLVLLGCGLVSQVRADPPTSAPAAAAAAAAPGAAQSLEPKGSFMSSLKQAFTQDFDKEVVRGHFEVGTPPDTHRYYCLVNPKNGKAEANGVSGKLVQRHDKMSGLTETAVSFFSCADAEHKGMLVTSPYFLTSEVAGKLTPVPLAAAATPEAAAAAVPASVPAPVPAAAAAVAAPAVALAATGPAADSVPPAGGVSQTEVMAAYMRFVAGQNAHDRAMVASVLLDSPDFVWAQYKGNSVWGYKEALDAFEEAWKGTWKLDPQTDELRIASDAPGVAVLITPLLFTEGGHGKAPATVPLRWGGVFVKTRAGWRIASIFISPYEGWRAPKSN